MCESERQYPFTGIRNIDYKRPVASQNDMRTAYHYGHRLIYGNNIDAAPCKKSGTGILHHGNPERLKPTSETKDVFGYKFAVPDCRYTTPSMKSINFIKSFDESALKFVPRPINEHLTTYKKHFSKCKRPIDVAPVLRNACLQGQIKNGTYSINPNERNYTKYMDLMASSYNLDYVPYSDSQVAPLAARDAITLWNWNEYVNCDITKKTYPAYISTFPDNKPVVSTRDAIKTRAVSSSVKCVPNKGLLTESREKYCQPNESIRMDVNLQQSANVIQQTRFTKPTTEYGMIGSGDRIQRYI